MAQAGPPPVSADGLWFWDGTQWKSLLSADRQKYWNGTAWVPLPSWLSPSPAPAGPPPGLAPPPPPSPPPASPSPPLTAYLASGALPSPPGYAPSAPPSTPPPSATPQPVPPRPSWLPADATWPPATLTAVTSAPPTSDAPLSAPAPGAAPWANAYSDVMAASSRSGYAYAGFWIRFVAYLVDSLIVGIPVAVVYLTLLGGSAAVASQDPAQIQASGQAESLLSLIASFIYFVFFWSQGSTPGMRLVKIRVADQSTFQTIGPGKAVLRFLGWIVSSFCCLIGFIWAAFDSRKQGWHDKIGGTVVVYR